MKPLNSEYSRKVLLKMGAYRSDLTTAAFRLSMTTFFVMPPKKAQASSMPAIKEGRSWVKVTWTYWCLLEQSVTIRP